MATRVIQCLSVWKGAACEQCLRPRRRPVGSPRQREAEKVLLEALVALPRISLPSQSSIQGRRDGAHSPTDRSGPEGRQAPENSDKLSVARFHTFRSAGPAKTP